MSDPEGRTYGIATDTSSERAVADEARDFLRRGARAAAFLHGRIAFPTLAPPIRVGDAALGELRAKPDLGRVTLRSWVDALYRGFASDDAVSLSWLANLPPPYLGALAARAGDEGPLLLAIGRLLSSIHLRDGRHGELLAEALGLPLAGARTTLAEIDEPALSALGHLLGEDGYTAALIELVERHERHYAPSPHLRHWLSPRGIALQRIARTQGVVAMVHSGILPPSLCFADGVATPP